MLHADGYIEVKDRSKDIIISGGENISSLEVEEVLYRHPAVMEAAVVAMPDDEMGRDALRVRHAQAGCARPTTAEDIIAWCREHLAHFKAPAQGRVRPAAQDLDRQDPEVRAARAGAAGMSMLRLSRISLVAAVAVFFTLVAIGNVVDYGTNWQFVTHVMSMDTTFRDPELVTAAP